MIARMGRASKSILALLVLASMGLALLRFNSLPLGVTYDDAHYIILAESLAGGHGYQLINFPRPQVERAFPPGWPILLVPLSWAFPGNYSLLKIFTLGLWLATLLLLYRFFSRRIPSPYAEIILGLTALNPLLVGTSATVMSETAYLLFSILTLTVLDKFDSMKNKIPVAILAAVLAFFTQSIRTIGIALMIAIPLYLLLNRRFRELLAVLSVFALGALLQYGWNMNNGGAVISSGYEAQVFSGSLLEKVLQMGSNLGGYLNETIAAALMPVFGGRMTDLLGPLLPGLINVLLLALIALGFGLMARQAGLPEIYVLIYLAGILAFWNPKVGSVKARFLIPMIPFFYFYLVHGLRFLLDRLPVKFQNWNLRILYAAVVVIALSGILRSVQDWRSPAGEQITDLSIGAAWVADHAPADSIVMVNEPVPSYVHVRRKTIGYPNELSNISSYVENQGIDYLIIAPELQSPRSNELDRKVQEQLLPILNESPEVYSVVFRDEENNVTVYQLLP